MVNHQPEPAITETPVETTSLSLIPTFTPTPIIQATPIPSPTPKPPPSERAVRAATFLLSTAPEKIKNDLKNMAEKAKTDLLTFSAGILDSSPALLVQFESIEKRVKDKKETAQSQALLDLYSNLNTYRPLINPPTSIHCNSQYFSTLGISTTDCY